MIQPLKAIAIFSLLSLPILLFAQQKGKTIEPNYEVAEKFYDAVQWRHIGPFRGGRSAAVCGVPNKPNLFYMGAAGGGVWQTKDGGRSWHNISDGFFGPALGKIETLRKRHGRNLIAISLCHRRTRKKV